MRAETSVFPPRNKNTFQLPVKQQGGSSIYCLQDEEKMEVYAIFPHLEASGGGWGGDERGMKGMVQAEERTGCLLLL